MKGYNRLSLLNKTKLFIETKKTISDIICQITAGQEQCARLRTPDNAHLKWCLESML